MRGTTANRFDQGIDILQRGGDFHHVPLLEAARDGVIDLVFTADRTARLPIERMERSTRPVVALIGDDDELSSGPCAWRCAWQLGEWAKGAIVHGTGGLPEHYRLAIQGAMVHRRFVIVDTSSRHIEAWARKLPRAQVVAIVPPAGAHPIEEPIGRMH